MPANLDPKDFRRFFEDFRHSAFRLETLDTYSVPEEEANYARFLKGDSPPPFINEDWRQLVFRNTRSGKLMERVHAISIPPSPYVKFEIAWGYVQSAAAGENVYLLNREDLPEGVAALPDFWLFDDQLLVLMEYDPDGRFLGVSRETDPAVVTAHVKAARVLKSLSTPLSQYLDKLQSHNHEAWP